MKKLFFSFLTLAGCSNFILAQTNYLDNYIGATITPTVIASSSNQVNQPQDLDFKPNSNELWISNRGGSGGGTNVIIYNAGLSNQTSQYRKDSHSGHFMIYPTAIAFGEDGKWACVSEIKSTAGASSTFMGPALWTGDTAIFARVFQNNWVSGYPLGSHYDMLHQSPFAMGIAHDSAMAYWVNDGHFGNIVLYDYVQHHGPGYDNHSAGKIWRYTDVLVTRTPNVPSHMILDKTNGWLYFVDGGPKKIKRMNVNSGVLSGNLTVPSTSQEPLAGYKRVLGAVVEELDTFATQPCGIDYHNNRLIVSDNTTGDIYLYNTLGTFSLMGTISTGMPGLMGVKIGPDSKIWCVNYTNNAVYRLDIASPSIDVSLLAITAPLVQNFKSYFYSTAFNICDGTITPAADFMNSGTDTITSVDFEFSVDTGAPVPYSWSGQLLPGVSASVTFSSTAVGNGSHELKIRVVNVNGGPDAIDLNNTLEGAFRTIHPPVTLPLTETFSAAVFPPSGWNYVSYNPNNKMTRNAVGGFGASVGSLKMDNFSGAEDISGQKDYLISPVIDMTAANGNTWLRFNVSHAKYNASSNDGLQVLASMDCGESWNSIYSKSGTSLSTAPVSTAAWVPTATTWRTDSVSLTAYAGQSEVLLAFNTTSNFGNNVYVDDIFVGDLVTSVTRLSHSQIISVFPNPVVDFLTVSIPLNQGAQLRVFNALGDCVLYAKAGGNAKIDVSNLARGIYLLEVIANNGQSSLKFIKE